MSKIVKLFNCSYEEIGGGSYPGYFKAEVMEDEDIQLYVSNWKELLEEAEEDEEDDNIMLPKTRNIIPLKPWSELTLKEKCDFIEEVQYDDYIYTVELVPKENVEFFIKGIEDKHKSYIEEQELEECSEAFYYREEPVAFVKK